MGMLENGMKPQVNKNINVFEQPTGRGISHRRTMMFKAFLLRCIVHSKAFLQLHTR